MFIIYYHTSTVGAPLSHSSDVIDGSVPAVLGYKSSWNSLYD